MPNQKENEELIGASSQPENLTLAPTVTPISTLDHEITEFQTNTIGEQLLIDDDNGEWPSDHFASDLEDVVGIQETLEVLEVTKREAYEARHEPEELQEFEEFLVPEGQQELYLSPSDEYAQSHAHLRASNNSKYQKHVDFGNFVGTSNPSLCVYCINLASVFSNSDVHTYRSSNKAAMSTIQFHKRLFEVFESSRTCSLCFLIIYSLPDCTRTIVAQFLHSSMQAPWLPLSRDGEGIRIGWFDSLRSLTSSMCPRFWRDVKHMISETSLMVSVRKGDRFCIREHHFDSEKIAGFYLYGWDLGDMDATRSLRVCAPRDSSVSAGNGEIEVLPNANSLEIMALAKGWIKSCFANHLECRWQQYSETDDDPPLPLRVLEVLEDDENYVRLACPSLGCGKWVALSHRWGTGGMIRLTSGNIESFRTGIAISSLPATFQDAIRVTRMLNISYLWIDSLCILQDLPADWQSESAKMPEIYQNAYVTIGAGATENSYGGILVERAWAPRSKPCKVPVKRNGVEGTVTIDLPLDHGFENETVDYLKARAWCFQESQLSHRLLTFDRLQMSYTCLRHGLLESRERPYAVAREEKNNFLPALHEAHAKDEKLKKRALLITWYQVLADYTSRTLTYEEDKLVAISGIARITGDFMEDTYHAGLWEQNLPQALLWSPYEEETFPHPPHQATLPDAYRAPSWSWASVESPISSFICRETLFEPTFAKVLDIQLEMKGSDKFGQVTSGYIEMNGPLRSEVLVGDTSKRWPYQPFLSGKVQTGSTGKYTRRNFGYSICDIGQLVHSTSVWLFQITKSYALILDHVGSTIHQLVFRRLGVAHLTEDFFNVQDGNTIRII